MPLLTRPFLALAAKDLMRGEVVRIPRDMGMQAAARWLGQNHISGAPVVDEQGRCVGVLSSGDFVACCAANRTRCAKHRADVNGGSRCFTEGVGCEWQMVQRTESVESLVRDHMTPDPVMAQPDTSIVQLAQMLVDAHIHRIIIVDEEQRPLGIVSTTDIVAAVAQTEAND